MCCTWTHTYGQWTIHNSRLVWYLVKHHCTDMTSIQVQSTLSQLIVTRGIRHTLGSDTFLYLCIWSVLKAWFHKKHSFNGLIRFVAVIYSYFSYIKKVFQPLSKLLFTHPGKLFMALWLIIRGKSSFLDVGFLMEDSSSYIHLVLLRCDPLFWLLKSVLKCS